MDVASLTVDELLRSHAAVMEELRRRGVVRSDNNPVSDLAELVFCHAFPEWERQGNSASGFDARDTLGVRYQIKSRRLARPTTSRQVSAIRKLPERPFNILAGVLFGPGYNVIRAALIPVAVVIERARPQEYTHAWVFHLRDDVWQAPGVIDVTERVRDAANRL